ncbi:MAG: hypothetical protein ACRD1P_11955, partial [Thermoanaerobaculia bacterium]
MRPRDFWRRVWRRERPDAGPGSTSRPDDRIRIVYVSHSAGLSGSERALLQLLEALDRAVIDPVVFLPQEGPLLSKLKEAAIPTRIQPSGWWIPATNWSAEAFLNQ